MWDQTDDKGKGPHAVDPKLPWKYGRLYTSRDIQEAINKGMSGAPECLKDPIGHGTHVASIAAGRRTSGGLADGMAPEANIVVVVPDMRAPSDSPESIGFSIGHVDALLFLEKLSRGSNEVLAQSMPLVINISAGQNAGAHDGTAPLEVAIDRISTPKGRSKGIPVVKSAGNQLDRKTHAQWKLFTGSRGISWQSHCLSREKDVLEFWYHRDDELELTLCDLRTHRSARVSERNPYFRDFLGPSLCEIRLSQKREPNWDARLSIVIHAPLGDTPVVDTGTWQLEVHAITICSGNDPVGDLWVEVNNSSIRSPVEFDRPELDITLTVPGTAHNAIVVAACEAEVPLRVTSHSSQGLTRDATFQPWVSAPGGAVNAACPHDHITAKGGTSAASAHVAGVLALALSYRERLKPGNLPTVMQLKRLLQISSCSGRRHSKSVGYGLINADAFLDEIAKLP